jgi:hypothetical protein
VGGFLVLSLREPPPRWGHVTAGTGQVTVQRPSPGHIGLDLRGDPREIFISEAHHPFWRVEPPVGPLRADAQGLMVLGPLTHAPAQLTLTYRPPALPLQVTLAGLAGVVALLVVGRFRSRPARLR